MTMLKLTVITAPDKCSYSDSVKVKSQHEAPNFANKVSEKFGKINSPGDCLLASEYS